MLNKLAGLVNTAFKPGKVEKEIAAIWFKCENGLL
jgi:hypothetical protein